MDKLEKLGYMKSDNHPEPCESGEWTTQDCRVIEYKAINEKTGDMEIITFYPTDKHNVAWVSAIHNGKRIPSPLNIEEVEGILEILKEIENERNNI